MKTCSLLPILILIICSCSFNKSGGKKVNSYFEGKIYYDITYSNIKEIFKNIHPAEILGDRAVFTYKEGNYNNEVFYNDALVMAIYRIKEEDRLYLQFKGKDTIEYYHTYNTAYSTEFTIQKTKRILDYECIELTIHSKLSENEYSGEELNSKVTFSKDLAVNPIWYKNFHDGGLDRIYKITDGLPLRIEKIKGVYTSIELANKVERIDIGKEELSLPTDKPIKEFDYGN
ncbi:MAG: hypothetical protein P1U56_17470 [Saprospiraceae bacterium]|nr:hypothetical protein [Saprospiraceae bacterium]